MNDLTAACRELTGLAPHLAAALTRDNTGLHGHGNQAGVPVNGDVLHAGVTIRAEIPPATAAAAETTGEPWRPRPVGPCLTAIPRFAERMHHLRLAAEAAQLEDDVHRWLRTVKLALGIRLPDFPVPGGWCCPLHEQRRPLLVIGAERFLRADGMPGELKHPGLIWCGHCGSSWPTGEWLHLGRILQQEAMAG